MNENERRLKMNNPMQNAMAFSYLLENGKKNILNDDIYNQIIKDIENDNSNSFMTPQFKKKIIQIARDMAKMEEKELTNYIFERVKEEREVEGVVRDVISSKIKENRKNRAKEREER